MAVKGRWLIDQGKMIILKGVAYGINLAQYLDARSKESKSGHLNKYHHIKRGAFPPNNRPDEAGQGPDATEE